MKLPKILKLSMLAVMASMLIVSCSQKGSNSSEPLKLISSDLLSDRPYNLKTVVQVVRLKSPSLVASASVDSNGDLVINKQAREILLKEQEQTLKAAKEISPEIKLIFSYKFTLNALALAVPGDLADQLSGLGTVTQVSGETLFKRPKLKDLLQNKEKLKQAMGQLKNKDSQFDITSVSHIGATQAHSELGITGAGVKVGVIDTGVDYTHTMLGGSGNVSIYEQMDKAAASPLFPNKKVVGGYDFAGTDYSPSAYHPKWRIPNPDPNPIDEGGHGTHVAGSVAGLGDGINTYDGVAPDADIYALKVFGNNGGTSDTVVIAAMEWAMDPNGDLDPTDRLDVLNLSLGGDYGKPYIMYSLAVKNLARAGVMTVVSAGNSGPTPFIVGAPGTAKDSISVGASVDGMDKNWQFQTIAFNSQSIRSPLYAKRIQATFTPQIETVNLKGKLVYVGEAATDFDQDTQDALKGNLALIDRGSVSFVEKITRAQKAGALGVIVANNVAGDAFVMGGEGKADIPAAMIDLDLGNSIKEMMKSEDVIADFNTDFLIEEPQLIDTVTTFSSQGPRSEDGLLKPEIVAPGYQIISAQMGSGDKAVPLNGTSMSSPHMAGVMALVKQAHPKLSIEQQKALVMNTADIMTSQTDEMYSITLQGAGLVNVMKALKTKTLALPSSLSLGSFQMQKTKMIQKEITIKNTSDSDQTYRLLFNSNSGANISSEEQFIHVAANDSKTLKVRFKLNASLDQALEFHEGMIEIYSANQIVSRVPVLAVSKRITDIHSTQYNVFASSSDDAAGALTTIKLQNDSTNPGFVELFNLITLDDQKPSAGSDSSILTRSCDVHAVGYRIVQKEEAQVLEIGMKMYAPVSSWQACELSVLIDSDGDGEAEQEVGGLPQNYLRGLDAIVQPGFYSVLLDFNKARAIRSAYDQSAIQNGGAPTGQLNFVPALVDVRPMQAYHNTHLAIMEVKLDNIATTDIGTLRLKFSAFSEGGVQWEDYVLNKWFEISTLKEEQIISDLPSKVEVKGLDQKTLDLTKGLGSGQIMMVAPFNHQVTSLQTQIGKGLTLLAPTFQ